MDWPNNKKFAFTIIDDIDDSFVDNIKPIYGLLNDLNIKTTKTVWVYPSRNMYIGYSLIDEDYYRFILDLRDTGFEIALHNVGSGAFYREEIINGIEVFKEKIGYYPKIQINHGDNTDNLYWGSKRFINPLKFVYKMFHKEKFYGDEIGHPQFWGDINQRRIKYLRNHCFYGINTLKYDKYMPYKVKNKPYVNYFFSASDGDTVKEFINLTSKKNIDNLEKQGSLCIVYTHFGKKFVNEKGELNEEVKSNLEYLSKKDGWFVPVSEVLDYLLEKKELSDHYASNFELFLLDTKWLISRILKKFKFKR